MMNDHIIYPLQGVKKIIDDLKNYLPSAVSQMVKDALQTLDSIAKWKNLAAEHLLWAILDRLQRISVSSV